MTGAVGLEIADIAGDFPGFRVAILVADGMSIPAQRPRALDAFIADVEAEVAREMAGVELADVPELRNWREAYRAFGVKKTSYRSSVERLLKNLQRGMGLPRVNALVDSYNAISALYRMPVGADDLDRVTPPVSFRYARPPDTFVALGDSESTPDPPRPGEVVYADAQKCLCRRWNWYQDARSAINLQTTQAVLTVQSLSADASRVRQAAEQLLGLVTAHSGGNGSFRIADAGQPRVTVRSD